MNKLTWAQRAAWYEVEELPTAEELRFWRAACRGASSVLVIPGGAGSLACSLTAAGRRTVVVDSEAAMVRSAGAGLAACPGDNAPRLGDLRNLALGETFVRVCVPRAALQLLTPDDQRRALVALGNHVDAHGLLIVDLVHFGHEFAGSTPFYDPGVADGVSVLDWVRLLRDGRWLARRRTQQHAGSGLDLEFAYSSGPSSSSARLASADAHAAVRLHAFDDAAIHEVTRSADLVVAWDTDAGDGDRSCRRRVVLARPDQPPSARSSSKRKCSTPFSQTIDNGPDSK